MPRLQSFKGSAGCLALTLHRTDQNCIHGFKKCTNRHITRAFQKMVNIQHIESQSGLEVMRGLWSFTIWLAYKSAGQTQRMRAASQANGRLQTGNQRRPARCHFYTMTTPQQLSLAAAQHDFQRPFCAPCELRRHLAAILDSRPLMHYHATS